MRIVTSEAKRKASFEAGLPCHWNGVRDVRLVAWLDRNPHFDLLCDWFDNLDNAVTRVDLFAEPQKPEFPKFVDVAGNGPAIASQLLGERGNAQLLLPDRLNNPNPFFRQAFHHVDWIGKCNRCLGLQPFACLTRFGTRK